MPLLIDKAYKQCDELTQELIDKLKTIKADLKILIILDNNDISVIKSDKPDDYTETLGLLKVTEIRISEMERNQFALRFQATKYLEDHLEKIGVKDEKERMN